MFQVIPAANSPTSYIYKLMKRKPLDIWEKERFVREKYILDLLPSFSIPVPLPIHASGHDIQDQYYGSIFMTKIDGRQLSGNWSKISNQDKIQIGRYLGKALQKIHSISTESLRFLFQLLYQ